VDSTRATLGCPAPVDPALSALLDHVAEELAREYVRLMERAAQDVEVDVRTSVDRQGA
jgi:hypothetical protein